MLHMKMWYNFFGVCVDMSEYPDSYIDDIMNDNWIHGIHQRQTATHCNALQHTATHCNAQRN